MIKLNQNDSKDLIVQMGSGDIGVNSGTYTQDEELVGVFIGFRNLPEPQPIGKSLEHSVQSETNRITVHLTFTDPTSIDVVINHLLSAKEHLKGIKQ